MDTLQRASPVSGLQVPSLPSTPREHLRRFKAPTAHGRFLPYQHTKTTSLSRKPSPLFRLKSPSPPFPSSPFCPSALNIHRKPATGYAAALLEISQSNNSLLTMRKDVHKLSNRLRHLEVQALLTDPLVGRKEKGLVVKALAGSGGLNRHLVGLSEMLVDRNKLEMVGEALEEFLRIFDELIAPKPGLSY